MIKLYNIIWKKSIKYARLENALTILLNSLSVNKNKPLGVYGEGPVF
jgi:hypothetical protein